MKQADRIRDYVASNIIDPARINGIHEVWIRAGDIHHDMELTNVMPAVCSAISGDKFSRMAGVTLIERAGPSAGSNAMFRFEISPRRIAQDVSANPKSRYSPKKQPWKKPRPDSSCDLTNALVLVSCVKSKGSKPAPARELYTSTMFTLARDFVESRNAQWRILSALYGLVEPETVIQPYDYTLNTLGVSERRQWASDILVDLLPLAKRSGRVIFLAGLRYREFLIEPLVQHGIKVEIPMKSLRQGEQLSWLKGQL